MYAIHDTLADAIIRSTLDPDPAVRARYRSTLQPGAPRPRLNLSIDARAPIAVLRRLVATVTASLAPSTPAQPTCCAAA